MINFESVFEGEMWVVDQSVRPDGRVFERARRAPGGRLIIVSNGKVLLSREKRHELGGR
jgi:hypothetical protein